MVGARAGERLVRKTPSLRSARGFIGSCERNCHGKAAQKHLWAYYERVALQRGVQGGRNTGKPMTYGEAYQRLFPMAVEELA